MSWNQWLDILRSGRDDEAQQLSEPPVCCPNDAQTLETGPDGRLFCPWDGWRQED